MTLNRFTDETIKGLPPHVYDNHYGQDFVQVPITDTEGKGTRIMKPFSHEFDFQTGGVTVTPVKISDIERTKKSMGSKLVGMFLRPAAPNLSRTILPHKGVIATGEESAIESLYPGATVEKTGNVWVVIQKQQTDIYNQITNLLPEEGREMLEARSLLSPRVREILQQYGEIIYESNPEQSDRVVVCFANIHGDDMSPFHLKTFIPHGDELFMQHQHRISDAINASLGEINPAKAHLFLESFPDPDIEDQKADVSAALWREAVLAAQTEYCIHALPEAKNHLKSTRSGRGLLLDVWHKKDGLQLHGDNRSKHVKDMGMKTDQLISGTVYGKLSTNTAGVASALAEQKKEVDQGIVYGTHSAVVDQIAKHLSAGETAFLVYGAGHFASYKTKDIDPERSMEGYFSFLPKTQVVVVLPHETRELKAQMDLHGEKRSAMKKENRMSLMYIGKMLEDQLNSLREAVKMGDVIQVRRYTELMQEVMQSMKSIEEGGAVLLPSITLQGYLEDITRKVSESISPEDRMHVTGAHTLNINNPGFLPPMIGGLNNVSAENQHPPKGDDNMDNAFM